MDSAAQLPSLLRLYDDPSPTVRAAVLAELTRWGDGLQAALRALDPAPDEQTLAAVLAAVARQHALVTGTQGEATQGVHAGAQAAEQSARALDQGARTPGQRARPHFALGQLVQHRRYGYRGVVVARDLRCLAPDAWYQANRSQPERAQPWYHVLVHGSASVTYAAQSSLTQDDSDDDVEHPWVEVFFDGRTGRRYLRNKQPWPHTKG
ncbi:MAG: heat shock protein HspQ [Planctomycetota bacterium]|nr:MAG: heat shock protein HspQ [Planctomycetota bacterium]